MIYHINFYTTQENIEGPYDQWEMTYTRAFSSRDEAVKFAWRYCERNHFDNFSIEEEG